MAEILVEVRPSGRGRRFDRAAGDPGSFHEPSGGLGVALHLNRDRQKPGGQATILISEYDDAQISPGTE
jgi:hypothetical protein